MCLPQVKWKQAVAGAEAFRDGSAMSSTFGLKGYFQELLYLVSLVNCSEYYKRNCYVIFPRIVHARFVIKSTQRKLRVGQLVNCEGQQCLDLCLERSF
jgi:hypothetical protein